MGLARTVLAWLGAHPRAKHGLQLGVALLVAGLCAFAVRNEWGDAAPKLEDASPAWVALALGAIAAYYLVFILGWLRILEAMGIRVSYPVGLQAEMASMLAKYVPGGVWTPAARVAAVERLTGEKARGAVLVSILVEAVLSALSGVAVFAVSLTWVHGASVPAVPLALFAVLCAALLHPKVFTPVFSRLLRRLGQAPVPPLPFPTMLVLFAFYCATWLLSGLALLCLIRGLGGTSALSTVVFLGGTAAIGAIVAVLAVFAPSGLGVREASMYGLLIAVTSNSVALGVTVLNRLAITVVELALFGGGVALWRLGARGRHVSADVAES